MIKKSQKIFVGLSGGVDSAVAALLLKEKGFDVTGVFLKEYDLSLEESMKDTIACSQENDRANAVAVAAALGIPFEEWDFRQSYGKHVVDYLVKEYRQGRTPNPDVMCNKHIKFGLFLKEARKRGADFIATGHYVKKNQDSRFKIQDSRSISNPTPYTLKIAKDKNKDQSYFLYTLNQSQLKHCFFPLGNLTKSEVRSIAKKKRLPNWDRKDSQGVCFIGKIPMEGFLKSHISSTPGPLALPDGTIVGQHQGAAYVTIGQRHGLGYAGGAEALAVVATDVKKNIVYAAPLEDSSHFRKVLQCDRVHWIAGFNPEFPVRCKARIRYRQPLQWCTISQQKAASATLEVVFDKPQRAVTPGQAIVWYRGQTMFGGGIIRPYEMSLSLRTSRNGKKNNRKRA